MPIALALDAKDINYSNSKPSVVGAPKDGNPALVDEKLKEVEIPELHTTMMYAGESMLRPDSKAVFIMFAGTGAKTEYMGIGGSMQAVAHKVLKLEKEQFHLKADPVAFENFIYFMQSYPEKRDVYLDRYSRTQNQVEMMNQALHLVVDAIPKDAEGRPTKKVWVVTRSTGAGVFLQLVDEAYGGKIESSAVQQVEGVIAMGLFGHTTSEIAEWDRDEVLYLREHPGLMDMRVQPLGVRIFKDMTWAPENAEAISLAPEVKSLPKILIMANANDQMTTVEKQLSLAERFSKRHPEISVMVLGMDTVHNSAAKSIYTSRNGKLVELDKMKRFSPVMEGIAAYISQIPRRDMKEISKAVASDLDRTEPGLEVFAIPQMFDAPFIESCSKLMERLGQGAIIGLPSGKGK